MILYHQTSKNDTQNDSLEKSQRLLRCYTLIDYLSVGARWADLNPHDDLEFPLAIF